MKGRGRGVSPGRPERDRPRPPVAKHRQDCWNGPALPSGSGGPGRHPPKPWTTSPPPRNILLHTFPFVHSPGGRRQRPRHGMGPTLELRKGDVPCDERGLHGNGSASRLDERNLEDVIALQARPKDFLGSTRGLQGAGVGEAPCSLEEIEWRGANGWRGRAPSPHHHRGRRRGPEWNCLSRNSGTNNRCQARR